MSDKESIKELLLAQSIEQASNAITKAFGERAVVALPNQFSALDLEKYLPNRRRARGSMSTASTDHFGQYTKTHAQPATCTFIDAKKMSATAVLNLGTSDQPGHADNRCILTLEETAAYKALQAVLDKKSSQKTIAEFLEDWQNLVICFGYQNELNVLLPTDKAISAVREITIEAARSIESSEQQIGAARTSLESIAAKSKKHPLPTHISFKCQPFHGLQERTFTLRLGVLTGDEKPALVLRLIKAEQHSEEMAAEFAAAIRKMLPEEMPVVIGTYEPKP